MKAKKPESLGLSASYFYCRNFSNIGDFYSLNVFYNWKQLRSEEAGQKGVERSSSL